MWIEIKTARNQVYSLSKSLSIILSQQSSYKSLWNGTILQKKDRGFVNVETYAIAAKEVKDDHPSVRKAANACNINFMTFQHLILITNKEKF